MSIADELDKLRGLDYVLLPGDIDTIRRAVEALRAGEKVRAEVVRIADAACDRCGHARCCACGWSCVADLRNLFDERPSAAERSEDGT